ncbi:Molybdopterin binding protein [Hesseltinella vesiculosa]|uniref:Molybdopterin binding protein n=1 Tax=Hesseltinella vesiculosa TaxID=101127 RepID=A0A1X2GY37_9FUNG|nr:Molybdopterin binding protein [Hesseltinella vesiculosa]
MGITLKKIEVVPDDTKAIADSVTQLSSHHHIVFTSGGIGPTMDDISYDAIAKAYGVDLSLDDETCQRMKDMAQRQSNDPVWELTDARKRMALFPTGANILRVDPKLWVPVVVVNNNIHILPGVPRLFEQLVHGLRPHIEQTMASLHMTPTKFHRVEIATSESEGIIAPVLNTLQDKFANVSIGSYPKWGLGPQGERVVVSIVGKDEQCVHQAAKEIQEGIQGWVYQQDSCP